MLDVLTADQDATRAPALQLLDQVRTIAGRLAHPAQRTRTQFRDALRDQCRAAGLLVSTTETTPTRGTLDGYRGRLALVVGTPTSRNGRGALGPPLALVAVEINRRSVRQRSLFKLQHIPRHIPALTLLILTAGASDLPQGVDSILNLGAPSAATTDDF